MFDDFAIYLAIGLIAQLVDGALGMAYGMTATSLLMGTGLPPVVASATVHTAEFFTTGASGFSHWRLGNVDKRLMMRLAIPGMVGGFLGAYVLTSIPGDVMKPIVSIYLLLMGLLIILRAIKQREKPDLPVKHVGPLGLVGGFLDAVGGGGWGPIVVSNLLGRGGQPRFVIGSVNAAEFFVTAVISATFIFTVGVGLWPIILGLVIGGVLAAPIAAVAAKRVNERYLMFAVGLLVLVLSVNGLRNSLGQLSAALGFIGLA